MKTIKEICIYMTIALPIYYMIPKDIDHISFWILVLINIFSSTVVSKMIYKKLES